MRLKGHHETRDQHDDRDRDTKSSAHRGHQLLRKIALGMVSFHGGGWLKAGWPVVLTSESGRISKNPKVYAKYWF